MRTVAELQAERAKVLNEAEKILDTVDADDRAMSDDEKSRYNLCIERAEQLASDVEVRMQLEDAQAVTMATSKRKVPPQTPEGSEGGIPASMKATMLDDDNGNTRVFIPRAYGKMTAYPKTRDGEMRAYRCLLYTSPSPRD